MDFSYEFFFAKPGSDVVRKTINRPLNATIGDALDQIAQEFEITDDSWGINFLTQGQILNPDTKFAELAQAIEVVLRPQVTLVDYPSGS
jgi:hypothetical protein